MTSEKAVKELIKFFRIYAPEPFPEFMHKSIEALENQAKKEGHWELIRYGCYACSKCGMRRTGCGANFCENCGADMRGGRK